MKKLLLATAIGFAFAVTPVAAAPPTMTLKANPLIVRYGSPTTLSGVLSTKRANQQITIEAQECGSNPFKNIATVKTTAGGAFSTNATPTINTVYRAKLKGATSPTASVLVRPIVKLKKLSSRKYRASVTAGVSLSGRFVTIQRWSSSKHSWTRVTRITLTTAQASGAAPTTVSSGTKRIKFKARLRIRAVLTSGQASCYTRAVSRAIRS